jgi:hypothetical protein
LKRKKKRNYRFSDIPTYETRSSVEKRETGEYAFLTLPDPARRYDSSLSRPGRLCKNCRSFVAGDARQPCQECYSL